MILSNFYVKSGTFLPLIMLGLQKRKKENPRILQYYITELKRMKSLSYSFKEDYSKETSVSLF